MKCAMPPRTFASFALFGPGLMLLCWSACTRPAADRTAKAEPTPASAFHRAETTLRADVSANPSSLAARGRLAVFLHANDQLAAAAALYEELRRDDPAEGRWPYLLARIRQDEGALDTALALLAEAAARAPEYPVIGLRRADLLFKTGDPTAAQQAYRDHLARVPASAHASLGLARVALQEQAWGLAESHLLDAIRADPTLGSSQALLVSVYEARGETERARKLRAAAGTARRYREPEDPWLDALALDCRDVEKLAVLADIAIEAGRSAHGIELLRRALALEPGRARTHLALAKALLPTGDRPAALDLLRTAARLDPALAEAHFALVAELQSTDHTAALAAADAAVRTIPRNAGLHRQRGLLLQSLNRLSEAEADLRLAASLDPADANNREALGNLLWSRQRHDEAASEYERARHLSRLAVKPRALLATYHLEAGRMAEAEACLREAAEIDPLLPGLPELRTLFHLRSGNAWFRSGDLARAEAAYSHALDIAPTHEESWTGLVAVWQRSGQAGRARDRIETLLREHPSARFAYGLAARVALQAGDQATGLAWIERGLGAARAAADRAQEQALLNLRSRVRTP